MEENTAITLTGNVVEFPGFEAYRTRCQAIADYIGSIELTDENEKAVKKDLADARKAIKALEDRRKEIKKEVLKYYDAFADQIKELTGIIDGADKVLRAQVNAREEARRAEKEDQLAEMFERRSWAYSFTDVVPDAFVSWVTPQHLNKSMSIGKCETDMTGWMEARQADYDTVLSMNDSDVLTEWVGCLDLAKAIQRATERRKTAERVQAHTQPETATFRVTGRASIELAKKLFTENGINFVEV